MAQKCEEKNVEFYLYMHVIFTSPKKFLYQLTQTQSRTSEYFNLALLNSILEN